MTNDRTREELIGMLAATPARLRAAFDALRPERLGATRDGGWDAATIIGHVRASDAIVATRIYAILARPGAPVPAFDERAWAEVIAPAAIPLDDQLHHFVLRRSELVAVLGVLDERQWVLAGEHESRGTLTVEEICGDIAEHEGEHCRQVEALAAGAR